MTDEVQPGRDMDRAVALALGWRWLHGKDTAGGVYTCLVAPQTTPSPWEAEGRDEAGRVLDWTVPAYSADKHVALDALECFCDNGFDYSIQRGGEAEETRYCVEIWNPVIYRHGATLAEAVCRAILAASAKEPAP